MHEYLTKMQLIKPYTSHIENLMKWFSCEQELKDWTGPNFRYPYDLASFSADLNLDSLNAFSLVDDKSNLLAFGQYYLRLNRCHLARLIVNPNFRGKGIAKELMMRLSELGTAELKVNTCSLFVLKHNKSAIKAYEKFGFSESDYPDKLPIDNCKYMIKG
ncbi:GNAT family N-acetyltransferase [Rheinheimera sediminis]|uniref:GNAT family N-acetyltransferase n=1 Tax=Rheinheimera sp. YQF-1 TaxID=2499626 RepID=UPI001C987432|nr:GNAT family N-acetyltransferase [Rheinheimera sp. YQF-1]